jgi:hypothetical protein
VSSPTAMCGVEGILKIRESGVLSNVSAREDTRGPVFEAPSNARDRSSRRQRS